MFNTVRPMLRNWPVAIVNRRTEYTVIVTAGYEAKARAVKMGRRLNEAKQLCPELVGLECEKYRFVYHQLMRIMSDYSPHFQMKSVDKGVIGFALSPAAIPDRDLVDCLVTSWPASRPWCMPSTISMRAMANELIHSADALGTGIYVKQKIAFGSTRYM